MALETGTYVDDLVTTNPPGTDDKRQGDDHIRLIKNVLRNTLKRASKTFSLPGTVSKSANYTVLSTDDNLTVLVDTSGAVTSIDLTLPSLTVSDAGWSINVTKVTTDSKPVMLKSPGGAITVNGFSYVRRSIEHVPTKVIWTGTNFVATRQNGAPIGSSRVYHGSSLPNGHLWADGSGFSGTLFLELAAALGGTTSPDLRGRAAVGRDDMGGVAAGRLASIAGTVLGTGAGEEKHTMLVGELAAHTHTATTGIQSANHTHPIDIPTNPGGGHSHTFGGGNPLIVTTGLGGPTILLNAGASAKAVSIDAAPDHTHSIFDDTDPQSADHTHSVTTNAMSAAVGHNNLQPLLVCNKIVVAE